MLLTSILSGTLNFATENITLSLVLILTVLYLWSEIRPGLGKRLPPAPWQFPIIGCLPLIIINPDREFKRLTRKFGAMYRIWAGGDEVIILNNYKAIKEAMVTNGENFSGRKQTFDIINYIWSNKGILVEEGWAWKEQRRFALSTLRDFGFGRFTMEDKIHAEAERIATVLKASNGKPTDMRRLLLNATANAICSVTFGKSFEYGDAEFEEVQETMINVEKNLQFALVSFMPWTRHVSKRLSGITSIKNFKVTVKRFLQRYIDQHKSTYDEHVMRDYLDCYLAEMHKREKTKDVGSFDEIRLRSNLFLMFFAGVATTSNTLYWAFKVLVGRPELQAELHEEIDRVVGSDRQVTYADRPQLPHSEAFLHEVQRFADVVPLGLPHANLEATTIMGYDIPKRSTLMNNLREVHQDPALWGDPENFRPSRFINEQGVVVRPEYLIPFGIGKRACMGEVLARMELFVILTSLLQKFSFTPEEGADTNINLVLNGSRLLPDYKVSVTPRK